MHGPPRVPVPSANLVLDPATQQSHMMSVHRHFEHQTINSLQDGQAHTGAA